MSSAHSDDRSFYSAVTDNIDDESGSTQHMPMPPLDPESQRWFESSEKLSVLGPTVRFKGELTADEDLMIQGEIEGSIHHHARHLTIGPQGRVKADIRANHIIVQGEVEGDMYGTEAVIIEASSRVRGNVFAPRVALKEGAKFKGSIDMDQSEPRQQTTDAPTSSANSKPAEPNKRRKATTKDTASETEVNELLE